MTGAPWRFNPLTALMLVSIALFFTFSASVASRPLCLDAIDFAVAAEQTAITGIPLCYRGEARPVDSGLFHPPLYMYSLAAWYRVFGEGPAQIRMFGAFCALLQGLVVLGILRTLFGREAAGRWAPWFWPLFLLNPYTLQTAAIADIDSTIYGPLLSGAVLAVLRLSWRDGEWRDDAPQCWEWAMVVLMLMGSLAAKLTTVWLTYPFVFLLLGARFGWRRAMAATAAITAASVGIFALGYQVYGLASGLDSTYSYSFTWMSFTQRGTSAAKGLAARWDDVVRNSSNMWPFMVAWTGLTPWAAAVCACGGSAYGAWRWRDRRRLHFAMVLALALACTVGYCAKLGTFGQAPFKYVFVYWGVVCAAALVWLDGDAIRRLRPGAVAAAAAIGFAAGAIYSSRLLHDQLMFKGFHGPHRWAAVAPAVLMLAGAALMRWRPRAALAAAGGLALYGGIQFGSAVHQERVSYSTTYEYGQRGFEETVAFLVSNTTPDDYLVSMKDIAFAAKRRYVENYGALYFDNSKPRRLVRRAILTGQAKYLVFTEDRGQDQLWLDPPFRDWVLARCTLVRSFGDYRIYRPTKSLKKDRAAECAAASQ